MHLHCKRVLDLTRPSDALVRLVEKVRLTGGLGDHPQTDRGHRDEEQGDEEEAREELDVHRGADARHGPYQGAEW